MKIAIDTRETARTKTGKGWYAFIMVQELLKNDPNNQYILYTQEKTREFEKYPNAIQKVFPRKGLWWHWAVLRDLKKNPPDFFWATTSTIIPALAPKSLKTFVTVHDLVTFILPVGHNRKAMWIERLTLKRAMKKAHCIVTVSENTKHDLKTRFHVEDKKIILTPCAASNIFTPHLDRSFCGQVQQKYKLPDRFILGVGTLSPRKNFTRLMKAYEQMALRHPEVHLVIVGDWGWRYDEIQKESGHPNIHLIGYVDGEELAVIYNLAKVFVFPSLYEGFGIPPLEAMACGCPVIVSNNSSLPEVVGEAGLQVDPYSVDEIARSMEIILTDASLKKSLIQKGFEQVKKFSWRTSAERLKKEFYAAEKKAVQ